MRFLVLNHLYGELTGSELNVLQLCQGLREAGHVADIGTFELRGPMVETAERMGIRIHHLLDEQGPELEYDVIWAHHAPILTHVIFRRRLTPCRVIFSSLSPLTPLESPPSYFQELPLILANSPRNVDYLLDLGVKAERIHYFPNFASKAFFERQRPRQTGGLKRIVIVSNHPPEEVRQMAELARADGLVVDIIGGKNPVLVDESMLPDYDLVLSIGKTVQYGFAQRAPVYCYDHFGGPGYINEENLVWAERGNFCGMWIKRKLTAHDLYADIKAGYAQSLGEMLDFLHEQARARFSLETNLARVCEKLALLPLMDVEGVRQRHLVAGRLNDVYVDCLRQRLVFADILRQQEERRLRPVSWHKRVYRLFRAVVSPRSYC